MYINITVVLPKPLPEPSAKLDYHVQCSSVHAFKATQEFCRYFYNVDLVLHEPCLFFGI